MIKNITKKTNIAKNVKIAVSFEDNLFGLLINKNSDGLIIKTRFGIHTLFLKEPIDILVLDKNNKVVRTKIGLVPNKLFVYNPNFNTIIELKKGLIKSSRTEIGDQIEL